MSKKIATQEKTSCCQCSLHCLVSTQIYFLGILIIITTVLEENFILTSGLHINNYLSAFAFYLLKQLNLFQ